MGSLTSLLLLPALLLLAAHPSHQRALLAPQAEPLAAAMPAAEAPAAAAAAAVATGPAEAPSSLELGGGDCLANEALLGTAGNATTQATVVLAAVCSQAADMCGEGVRQGPQGLSAVWAVVFAVGGVESLVSGASCRGPAEVLVLEPAGQQGCL